MIISNNCKTANYFYVKPAAAEALKKCDCSAILELLTFQFSSWM